MALNEKRFQRRLPVRLTGEQMAQLARDEGMLVDEIDALETEAKKTAAGYKSAIKDKRAELLKLAEQARTRTRTEMIDCFERLNYAEDRVEVVRADTFEVIESRTANDSDRQQPLFGAASRDTGPLPAVEDPESAPTEVVLTSKAADAIAKITGAGVDDVAEEMGATVVDSDPVKKPWRRHGAVIDSSAN